MNSKDLDKSEYADYFSKYIHFDEVENLIEELEICIHGFIRFVQDIPMDKFDYRYAEGKWTIKEMIQHLIDTERIFSYRALRIARNDKTPLPGFDENAFSENCRANERSLQGLLTEMATVRQATLALFKSFTEEDLKRKGFVADTEISVRAIGFILIRHQKHHQSIFLERYL